MNRLDLPVFDNDAALDELANNALLASHPHLLPYVDAIKLGYAQYQAAQGNAHAVLNIALPANIGGFLKGHYASPPKVIEFIDRLRDEGEINTCPMCGSFFSGTLDHIFPKEDFAVFAIFGLNLVPACKCNSRRGTALIGPGPGERVLHPYFDDVLDQRLLGAHFEDLGQAPLTSIQLLIDPADADYAAVAYHYRRIVMRTRIADFMRRSWSKLIVRPSNIAMELRHNPQTRGDLEEVLERQREREDDVAESRNNWKSVFLTGLLEDEVVDWMFDHLSRPGRDPDGALLPEEEPT
ncbi:HNH endonuclease signature motif containing protein [Novosphingobium resinovorum]|uniref:HNH endonuclease n=1 Tax=Novosphingobium resinovorum TaxID=158500 RepID=UPI002ED01773|nr:HNH endonuclease signature motif containing protein [Novosphingobium resinovorum]